MKKKDIADSGAQYAGTQPIQHAEVVLGQPAPEPAKTEQKPKPDAINKTEKSAKPAEQPNVLPSGVLPKREAITRPGNARIRKTTPKPIL